MEFSVAFSGQVKLHFLNLSKRDRSGRIIRSEVSDTSEPGSGYISTRNMAAELPEVLDVPLDDLHNNFFF